MKTNTKILLLILVLAIALRLPSINDPLFGDAIQWERWFCTGQFWFTDTGHPSLPGWLTNASCILFGVHHWASRLPFLLISLATILLTYFYGRKFISESAGLLAALLLALSPWYAGIGMGTGPDNYLVPLFALGILAYHSWLNTRSKMQMSILAIVFGLSLITKSAAVLLPGIILAHQFWIVFKRQQSWVKILKLWPMLFGFLIPIAYYSIQLALGSTTFTGYTVHRTAIKLVTAGGYSFPTASWVLAIVLASPAFFALLALMLAKHPDQEKPLLWAWIIVPAFVYSFLIVHNNIERFLHIALPGMALVISEGITSRGSKELRSFFKRKSNVLFGIASAFVLLLAFILPNPDRYASPYYSASAYIPALFSPSKYLFPIISDLEPTYYLPMLFVIFSGIVAVAWFAAALYGIFTHKKQLLKMALIMLLVTCITTNLIVLAEQHFSIKGPDIPEMANIADKAISQYAGNNKSLLIIGAYQVDYQWRNEPKGSQLSKNPANLSRMFLSINKTEAQKEGGVFVDPVTGLRIQKAGTILLRSEQEFVLLKEKALKADLVLFEEFPPLPQDNILKQALKEFPVLGKVEHRGLAFTLYSVKRSTNVTCNDPLIC